MSKSGKKGDSTLAALLREKPKRGRPPHAVSRQNVYVELTPTNKQLLKQLAAYLPDELKRADLSDLAVSVLTARLEALRRAVAGRNREIPEGITDLESLYLLWDLPLPDHSAERSWTSIRLSPQQSIELGRAHGTFNAIFGSNRSDTFELALGLLQQFLEGGNFQTESLSLLDMQHRITDSYL